MFTDECSYTKCFYYICIVNDLLYEKRKIKEMKVKKKKKKKKPLEERICPFCDEIENETHVLFNCDLYDDFRNKLFRKALNVNPDFNVFSSEEKLIFLLSNHFMIRYTAKTCFNILQRRTFYLSK